MKNDYEMTLNGESTVIPCEDSCDVPMVQCDFVAISDLENKEKDSIVGKDVRSVVTKAGLQVEILVISFGNPSRSLSIKNVSSKMQKPTC